MSYLSGRGETRAGARPAVDAARLRVAGKRALDVAVALTALVVLAPVLMALIRLVRRDGGAAFYAQRRVGLHGREFRCYKLRTMVPNAEQRLTALLDADPALRREYLTYWKLKDDPRVTRLGAFLRRTSLDELPQLINVLAGEMSLVGPRPRSVSEVAYMEASFPSATLYSQVKPGLTGPWQVAGRNHLGLAQKAALDADYVRTWTLRGDLRLLVLTVGVVLSNRGAA